MKVKCKFHWIKEKSFAPHVLTNRPNSLVENPFPPHSDDKKKFGETRFLSLHEIIQWLTLMREKF